MPTVSIQLPLNAHLLYPPVDVLTPNPPKPVSALDKTTAYADITDVIRHYTLSSLACDGIAVKSIAFAKKASRIAITLDVAASAVDDARRFGDRLVEFLVAGRKASNGVELMKSLPGAWNPMEGYRVNFASYDGPSRWALCLPLGMGILNQRAVTLMHYPPYIAMTNADYLHNNTLSRWQNLLGSCGLPKGTSLSQYTTVVDVNPVAAPGSGESEYPNDYFPIMMSSAFFDNAPADCDYIRSMLSVLLHDTSGAPTTMPLLVCGSPLYDPQAPGWFRVAFKDQLPQKFPKPPDPYAGQHGIPLNDVLQAGTVRFAPDAPPTPYMIANHMIAAGVTGRNTGKDPANGATLPDIRKYEGQDLAAASFLLQYAGGTSPDPAVAKKAACQRWFGNDDGAGAPVPPSDADKAKLCALALVDLFFNVKTIEPWYTLAQTLQLVSTAVAKYGPSAYNPCDTVIYPSPLPMKPSR